MAKKSTSANVPQKLSARKRSPNAGVGPKDGAPSQHQDPKRRLGNFTGAGEHARVGGRTTGIVGRTKQHFRGDRINKKP